MLNTYRAVLKGNRLEWSDEPPERLPTDQGVAVHVTILGEASTPAAPGRRMARALEQLAATAATDRADPVAWEREVRRDRPLPGRDTR